MLVFSRRFHLPSKFHTWGSLDESPARNGFGVLESQNRKETQGEGTPLPFATLILRSTVTARPCFEDRWEYSNENTRFQIDQPKQLDA